MSQASSGLVMPTLTGMPWHHRASSMLTSLEMIISLFAHVDGVLACDHAIAHLGGLWGINTALMLPSFCDGRWSLQSTTSIFPSVRLFHKSNQVDRCHQQC